MLPRPTLISSCTVAIASDQVIDIVLILFDHSLDALAIRPRLRPGVRDGPAKTNIVPNEVSARRILERVLHICLLDLEVAIDIAAIVCFAALRHLLLLLAGGLDSPYANWRRHHFSRASRRPCATASSLRSGEQSRERAHSPRDFK
jgi:hypothetical protein